MRSILIGLFIVASSLKLPAQSKAALVAAIRKDFNAINADKSLVKKTLSDEELSEHATDGGAELTGYFKKGDVVKMIEWIGFSYGNRTREFYLKNGKVFFAYEKFQSFVVKDSTVAEVDHSKVTTTFEGRYYFHNEKLVEQKLSGKRTFDENPGEVLKEMLESAAENVRLLTKAQ